MGNEDTSKPNALIRLKGLPSVRPTVMSFFIAGTTCMFALPIELTKVRVQLGQGSAGQVTLNILKSEGITTFYKGMSAGLLRGVSRNFARPELYKILTSKATETNNDRKQLSGSQKALYSLTVNAVVAFVTSPADLALTRMQADATLPAAQRRNYTNVFHAFYRIIADEGVLKLWKGSGPVLMTSLSMNAGFFATCYPSAVFFKKYLGLDAGTSLVAACIVTGFVSSACGLPFDYIKTQIQKMQPDAGAKYPYTGSLDCAVKTLKSGGMQKIYTGFPLYILRFGVPQVMLTWYVFSSHQKSVGRSPKR